jgi:Tfp pilus assembly protein PilF
LKQEAVDFLKKLFGAGYVQELVTSMSTQTIRESSRGLGYDHFSELALKHISKGEFDAAWVYANKAVYIDPNRPEAFNLIGGLCETRKNRLMAEKYYRAALALNSSYKPAQKNLDRVSTRPYTPLGIDWGLPVGMEKKTAMK